MKKFDIDGDGAFSLQEAYIAGAEQALEDDEKEARQKKNEELQTKKEKQERRIEERLKRRQQKHENQVAEKEQQNLKVGDAVEVRIRNDSTPMQAKIVKFDGDTYEVTFRGGEGSMNGLHRKQLKLLPSGFGSSARPSKDRRKIPTKTMRSTSPAEGGDRHLREEYKRKLKMRQQQESDSESSESSDVI